MFDADALAALGAAVGPPLVLPVGLWTVLALVAEAVLRRPAVPAASALAIRRGLLFSLPVAVAAPFVAERVVARATETLGVSGLAFELPALVAGPAAAPGPAWTVWSGWGAAVCLAGLVGALAVVRLGVAAWRLRAVRARTASAPEATRSLAARLAAEAGLGAAPHVALGPAGTAPFTLGARRPVVVVPRDLVPPGLGLALAHELSHVRRRDFAWTLAERAVAAVCAAHPLVHRLARGAALDRECLADADVLAAHPSDRRAYADLLLRFAAVPPPALAVGVAGLSPLKHRITAMTHPTTSRRTRRAHAVGRAVAAAVVALTLGVGLAGASPAEPVVLPAAVPAEPAVRADTTLPQLVGGLGSIQARLVYPRIQRDAGIEGQTVLQFVVDEAGAPRDVEVVRSSGDTALDQAALRAMDGVEFVPGTVDGRRVPVRFALPITFRLGDRAAAPPPPPPPPAPEGAMPELVGGLAALQSAIEYPELQKRAGVEGTAFVEFVVDERGVVRDVTVARTAGDPALDAAAVSAVRSVVFRPGTKDGRAVAVEYIVPVRFVLPDAD